MCVPHTVPPLKKIERGLEIAAATLLSPTCSPTRGGPSSDEWPLRTCCCQLEGSRKSPLCQTTRMGGGLCKAAPIQCQCRLDTLVLFAQTPLCPLPGHPHITAQCAPAWTLDSGILWRWGIIGGGCHSTASVTQTILRWLFTSHPCPCLLFLPPQTVRSRGVGQARSWWQQQAGLPRTRVFIQLP